MEKCCSGKRIKRDCRNEYFDFMEAAAQDVILDSAELAERSGIPVPREVAVNAVQIVMIKLCEKMKNEGIGEIEKMLNRGMVKLPGLPA